MFDSKKRPPAVKPLKNLRPEIMAHLRRTWKPVTAPGSGESADSSIGGDPGLLAGEGWPACRGCQGPLTFFLQINLAETPEEFGTGLL
jgi:uncharacterized protein YwqG